MIVAEWFTGDTQLAEVHAIRRAVFMEEQGVSEAEEMDGTDAEAIHLLLRDGGVPVATGRIIIVDGLFYLGRIAVLKDRRNMGYGDFLCRLLIRRCFELGGETQYIHSQTHAVGFYEKLGFTVTSEEYMEADIPHVNMERHGDITGRCG